ncbi:glycosyltransferase family 39 protein [Acidisoma cellulosilytica]|uniref:Glycosyltransferase family 39 protein n=1 Tax=Acidisoma cellulosilyticum TaxID=2802395 RepID=A0A964E3Z5_9PROT|nr:glycosyltransferase family 39 protein [Acidisoma cellulosilyticum]MCB8880949.1 glycosyltransferase family 39 protein [Acidisoma cellulosilyticum]
MSPLFLLILVTSLLRLLLGSLMGLGIDETYMVAASHHLELSYFDHPPIAWWLTHAAMWVTGSDAPVVARLPFILLFALSTWLMARITTALFHDKQAGFWAALLMNLSPVYGLTAGGWVLPDGPLDCALLGFLWFSLRATAVIPGGGRWGNWLGAGLCAGLAMLSKYNGALVLIGLPLFLVTAPKARVWLMRPQPWIAGLLAVLFFLPVVIWNQQHHWASFAFQGDRAGGLRFQPFAPFGVWAGEALFVLPWIWVPLILLWLRALRRGPSEPRGWLLALFAATPVLLFAVVSIWSSRHILYHWSAPGTLMLFPLLGAEVARRLQAGAPRLRRVILGTVALVLVALALVGTEMRFNWLTAAFGPGILGKGTDVAGGVDWNDLAPQLAARGLLSTPNLVVAVTRWNDAGKVDYALGGRFPVTVLADDTREYGIVAPADHFLGRPMLLLTPDNHQSYILARFAPLFDKLMVLPPVTLRFGGYPFMTLSVLAGTGFRGLSPADVK